MMKKFFKRNCNLRSLLLIFIIIWPLANSFFGIDLGDTGLHTYIFTNLYKTPDLISFTSYFTTVVGWVWLQLFGFLGLWGLNLLEVLLEWSIVGIVYFTFKSYIKKEIILLGSCLALLCMGTYLNAFNYHQFNVLLLVILMCIQFKAIVKNKYCLSFVAGIILGTTIFSRTGSITSIVTVFIYIYWYFMNKDTSFKSIMKHIFYIGVGLTFSTVAYILLLFSTDQLDYFINNIFRLKGLAVSSDGGYSFKNLLETFLRGNMDAIGSGLLFFSGTSICFLSILYGLRAITRKYPFSTNKSKVVDFILFAIFLVIGFYILVYSYDVNPAPSWPQMTSGPSFIIGVMYVSSILSYFIYMHKSKEKGLIVIISVFLPLLTIAGSSTGTKHVVMGMWIIGPVFFEFLYDIFYKQICYKRLNGILADFNFSYLKKALLITLVVFIAFFSYKLAHMVYYTNNFDATNRLTLRFSINSDKTKFLKTTKRQAETMNNVLNEVNNIKLQMGSDVPMLVYGGSVLYYYLSDSLSYVQPWVTLNTYATDKFQEDLDDGGSRYKKLPIIIYGKTNNYYGFSESDYNVLVSLQYNSIDNGKKKVLSSFTEKNNYSCVYVDDYYAVFSPLESKGENPQSKIDAILGAK